MSRGKPNVLTSGPVTAGTGDPRNRSDLRTPTPPSNVSERWCTRGNVPSLATAFLPLRPSPCLRIGPGRIRTMVEGPITPDLYSAAGHHLNRRRSDLKAAPTHSWHQHSYTLQTYAIMKKTGISGQTQFYFEKNGLFTGFVFQFMAKETYFHLKVQSQLLNVTASSW